MTSTKKFDVGIIGLGYVGLTLATVFAEVGLRVIGVEKRPEVVRRTCEGKPHFTETGLADALGRVVRAERLWAVESFPEDSFCDVYVITVGTPLGQDGIARVDMIEAAARQVALNMHPGAMVILRSTVKIGTTRQIVAPILAASGKSFDIAMCPERTLEGRALQELRELPQIVGADSQEVRDRAASVFQVLTRSLVQVSSLEAAEIVKLVDNTFRDVQFAFANEVARLCETYAVSAPEVIASGKLGYVRTNVALPGLVGGPCLAKDPHILMQSAKARGIDLEITRASRMVNERQPKETVDFIVAESRRRGFKKGAKLALMGMAFKGLPATDDLRGSMSIKVLNALVASPLAYDINLYDPVISMDELAAQFPTTTACATLEDAIKGADVVVIANNHPELARHLPAELAEMMNPNGFIYDYWNNFSSLSEVERRSVYFAVGNTGGSLKWLEEFASLAEAAS
jgi:UDP-N-acetyl-D-mannosaminuronic acid dehydrogenase